VVLALLLFALPAPAEGFIYWGDYKNGRVGRAANDGSSIDPNFITGAGSPAGVAISASHIYWANYATGTIGRANIDGTGVDDEFIVEIDASQGVAVNSSSIFWTSSDLGAIGRADLDGTDTTPKLVPSIEGPCGISLDSGHIFWSGAGGTIGRSSLGGGFAEPEFVDPGGGVLCGVAVTSTSIYWVTTNTGFIFPGVTIGRAKVSDGKEVDNSIIGDANGPCGITIFGSQLYWANSVTNTIGRANIDGNGASGVNQSYIATGGTEICGIAVDSLAPPPAGPPAPAGPADTTAPRAAISKGPGKKLKHGIARFRFKSNEAGSFFRCKLDRKKAGGCKSPKTYRNLRPGRHAFKVWAIDSAGNKGTPAKRSFRVPGSRRRSR
jgi:hypothetical protein